MRYTVQQDYSAVNIWNKSLEDEMMTRIANDMAREIDWGIMAGFCLTDGWTEVELDATIDYNLIQVEQWAKSNCKSNHLGYRHRWLFKEAADATWFTMRWS